MVFAEVVFGLKWRETERGGGATPAFLARAAVKSRATEEVGCVVHALWRPRRACSRVGGGEHTVAWPPASICQLLFTFEGFAEALQATSTTCNSLF